jgi:hypothetical protein
VNSDIVTWHARWRQVKQFLSKNLSDSDVQVGVKIAKSKEIDRVALNSFENMSQVKAFVKSVKTEKIRVQENGKPTEKLIFTKDKQKWVINKIKDCYGENGSTADPIAEFMHEKGEEIRKSSDPSHDTPKKALNIEKTEKLVEKVSKYAGLNGKISTGRWTR